MLSQFQQVPLSEMQPGEEGIIGSVGAASPFAQRLLEMGFIRGQRVRVEKVAPLGDPMEVVLKGHHLILRREEGTGILVRRTAP